MKTALELLLIQIESSYSLFIYICKVYSSVFLLLLFVVVWHYVSFTDREERWRRHPPKPSFLHISRTVPSYSAGRCAFAFGATISCHG